MALRASILKTLAYADIFDYPLTLNEINYWLIGPKAKYTSGVYLSTLPMVDHSQDLYFFKGRKSIVKLRQARSRWSQEKLKLARRVGEWLKVIPTIQMVALTGALAMSNSAVTDDIDLMIVTSPHTLWLTRPLVLLLL